MTAEEVLEAKKLVVSMREDLAVITPASADAGKLTDRYKFGTFTHFAQSLAELFNAS